MEKYIYPEIEVREPQWYSGNEHGIKLLTTLRFKHEGEYYLWHFIEDIIYPPSSSDNTRIEHIKMAFQRLHHAVYLTIILGKLPSTENSIYTPLCPKDADQTPEDERLIDLFPYLKSK